MMRYHGTYAFTRVFLVLAIVCSLSAILPAAAASPCSIAVVSVLGTWKGESICVGNRPACKNEIVVYRFESVPDRSSVVLLFADKIIDGQRVPMGKLEFQYNEAKGELSCEFTKNQTHGLWEFTVKGDALEGTLVLLPGTEPGRRVKVKRVSESEVPKAPGKEEYEGS